MSDSEGPRTPARSNAWSSFGELALACNLGVFTDGDYAALFNAFTSD